MTCHFEHLEVKFTDAEKLEMGRDVARLNQEKRRLDQKLTEIKKQLTGEISGKETEIDRLMDLLSNGYEYRQVECRIELDVPSQGKASIIRMDTNEVVRVRRMTDEEMQIPLPLAEAAPVEEPTVEEPEPEPEPEPEAPPVEVVEAEIVCEVAGPLREYSHSKNGGSCSLIVHQVDGEIRMNWVADAEGEHAEQSGAGKAYPSVVAAAKDGMIAIWNWAYALINATTNPTKRAALLSVVGFASDGVTALRKEEPPE